MFWTTLGEEQGHEWDQAFSVTKKRNIAGIKEEASIYDNLWLFLTIAWHLQDRNKDSYISLDNKAHISIAAPAAQSIHWWSSQVKPSRCERSTCLIRIKSTKAEQTVTVHFIHTWKDFLYVLLQTSAAHLLALQIWRLLLARLIQLHHLTTQLREGTKPRNTD